MKDLTRGSIEKHILSLAVPIAAGAITQIAFQVIDLYFVSKIGTAATAGVNAAGNVAFVIMALVQILGAGSAALVAHAAGRKDQTDANIIFNQCMTLALISGVAIAALISIFMEAYLTAVAASAAIVEAGSAFLRWLLPGSALALPIAVLGSALRGIGIVRPSVIVSIFTIVLNIVLAPVLILGWGQPIPLGVKGAGLATTIATIAGLVAFIVYFHRVQKYMSLRWRLMKPSPRQWSRILAIGLPVGGEMVLIFLYGAVVYYTIRDFGDSAQAGFGIGLRTMQVLLLPGMAIAFALGPIAGQNFGARNSERVKEALYKVLGIGASFMIMATMLAQWQGRALVNMFPADAPAINVATGFLRVISWAFVAQGIVYTCSIMFQSLGNTIPSFVSSVTQLLVFSISAIWVSAGEGFRIENVWYLTFASIGLQAGVSLYLLRIEFKRRLPSGGLAC